jgi:penicillin-binding protein 1A
MKKISAFGMYIKRLMRSKIFLKTLLYLLAGFIVINGILILLVISGVFGKLPNAAELKRIQNPVATEVYTADSILMGKYYIQNRQYMAPGQITGSLKNILIATEDRRFYDHHGIDFMSLGRVAIKTILLRQGGAGGGSTITQQLAKNLYPRGDYGFISMPVNKLKEMAIAVRIENVYTKDDILDLYLGTVPFGENTFGIRSASMRFFNTEPRALKVEETAVLIGMLKATGSYNPTRFPEKALIRRNVVLGQMARYKYIEQAYADSLRQLPIELDYRPLPHDAGIAPYFREYLRGELDQWCRTNLKNESEHYDLYTDGLKVYTTIDSRLQQYAEEAMREHMASLQELFDKHWLNRDLWVGIPKEMLLINYDGKYSKEMAREETRKMDVFTWEGLREKEYNTLDSIRHYLQFLQTGFLAMDVRSGKIKAWVGGINFEYFKYDHVLAKRQVGSTFKPLVYLAALEQGISPCDFYPNDSVVYQEYDDWTPRNADRKYGGYYSLKGALVHSVNTISVNLLMEAGIDTVMALGQKAGIESSMPEVPSLALGTANISLFEMMRVYQAIANRGIAQEPTYLNRIEDRDGEMLYVNPTGETGRAISQPENAEVMIEILRGVVNQGTASALRREYQIIADVAGKTGTTQNHTDGWFIGFTPSLVAGVWVGGDLQNLRFRNITYGQGAFMAMPIWSHFMKRTFSDDHWEYLQDEEFEISESTKSMLTCDDFRERKPFQFKPFKKLKEKSLLKKLFKRKKK